MLTKLSKTEENSVIKEARVLFQKCAPGGNVAKIFLRLVCFVKLYFVECYYQTQLFEPCLRRMDSAAFRNFQIPDDVPENGRKKEERQVRSASTAIP